MKKKLLIIALLTASFGLTLAREARKEIGNLVVENIPACLPI